MTDPLRSAQNLLDRLNEIDRLLSRAEQERDLHEKLAASAVTEAAAAAAETRAHIHLIVRVVAFALLLWTPAVSYGAIWFHELQRNTCYPAVRLVDPSRVWEPWYCSLFPGTGRHAHAE